MNLTTNFILLFLIIIFPGIVFRRFYFYGDFNKQFKIKEPLNNLFISNIIPGVILLVSSLFIINSFEKGNAYFNRLLTKFFILNQQNSEISTEFFSDFILLIITTLGLSILSGYLFSRIIRLLKWDIKFKMLQYKNVWHYIFSGEISRFKKFKDQFEINIYNNKKNTFYPPYVDILISKNGRDVLYSGFLLDYEVDQSETSQLNKVYLKRPKRYKRKEDGTTEEINIPGDLFILNTEGMINLNIRYYPVLLEEGEVKKSRNYKKYIFIVFSFLNLLVGVGYFITLFIKTGWSYYDYSNWYQKFMISTLITQSFNLLSPEKIFEKSKKTYIYKYTQNKIWLTISITVILFIIFWFIKR